MASGLKKLFGSNIKKYRYKKKLTQEKFAELTDSNVNHISDIENGRYGTTFDKLEKFAEVLGVKPADLFKQDKKNINLLPRVDMVKKNKENSK